jgi:glycosyltransferase involved in cell wall biosynthesis
VSCTIVCQNEAAVIDRCLGSVAWCDEIVVVDGGSDDGTVERARRYTDRILHHPWPGYRAQKQYALDHAASEWVLNVDADEVVTAELAAEVRRVLADGAPGVNGFAVPRLVCYLGRWWFHGGWYPRRIIRLMRRSAARWGGVDPHERAEVSGRVQRLRWPILHYTYTDVSDHLRSLNKLTGIAAVAARAPRIGAGRLFAEPLWRFLRAYVVQRGVLDGFPGLFVAATGAFYVFLRWAKVRERETGDATAALDPPRARP